MTTSDISASRAPMTATILGAEITKFLLENVLLILIVCFFVDANVNMTPGKSNIPNIIIAILIIKFLLCIVAQGTVLCATRGNGILC